LAASVCEGSGDERVAGSEVVDEHPGARCESVCEVPEGDLAASTGHEQFCCLSLQTSPLSLVARSTRCCNVVTRIRGRLRRNHDGHRVRGCEATCPSPRSRLQSSDCRRERSSSVV
jgi:hypothetical protein